MFECISFAQFPRTVHVSSEFTFPLLKCKRPFSKNTRWLSACRLYILHGRMTAAVTSHPLQNDNKLKMCFLFTSWPFVFLWRRTCREKGRRRSSNPQLPESFICPEFLQPRVASSADPWSFIPLIGAGNKHTTLQTLSLIYTRMYTLNPSFKGTFTFFCVLWNYYEVLRTSHSQCSTTQQLWASISEFKPQQIPLVPSSALNSYS